MNIGSIIWFISTSAPIIAKIAKYVLAAAKELEGKPGAEKMAWVMERLKVELPKFTGDQLYDWINLALNVARTMGLKV